MTPDLNPYEPPKALPAVTLLDEFRAQRRRPASHKLALTVHVFSALIVAYILWMTVMVSMNASIFPGWEYSIPLAFSIVIVFVPLCALLFRKRSRATYYLTSASLAIIVIRTLWNTAGFQGVEFNWAWTIFGARIGVGLFMLWLWAAFSLGRASRVYFQFPQSLKTPEAAGAKDWKPEY